MSKIKRRRPEYDHAGRVAYVQSLTGADTGTQVTNYGVTLITSTGSGSAGDNVYSLAAPEKGIRKEILAYVTSTKAITVRTASSAATFYGASTENAITFSTGSTYTAASAVLVGVTSAQWAILSAGAPLAWSTATNDWQVTLAGATA